MFGGGGWTGATGPTTKFTVNYYSNTIAIDFRGGEKVSRRSSLFAPGEILLWEPDGTLVVRNESDDKAAIGQLKAAEAPSAGGGVIGGGGALPRGGDNSPLRNLEGPDAGRRPARSR